ncbi:MAG: hypothetical protein QME05_01305 [Candidatus Margulisbacteria bacterium]|nr:hypothetical protein [Candidatus Margulisiibacteriota bacterium]
MSIEPVERPVFELSAETPTILSDILRRNGFTNLTSIAFSFVHFDSLSPEQQERNLRIAFQLAEWQCSPETVAAALLIGADKSTLRRNPQVAHILENRALLNTFGCDYSRGDQIDLLRSLLYQTAISHEVLLLLAAEDLFDLPSFINLGETININIDQALRARHVTAWILKHLGFEKDGGELEDLGLLNSDPERLQAAEDRFQAESGGLNREDALSYLSSQADHVSRFLTAQGIGYKITFRVKRPSSVDRKLQKNGATQDILGVRIILESDDIDACHFAHSIIISFFTGRGWGMDNNFHRDYITHPKSNGYRSLHDLLRDSTGTAIELQTRTRQMDIEAEIGAASHAQYKTGEQSCLASNAGERFAAKQQGMENNGVVIVYDKHETLHKLVPEVSTEASTALDLAFSVSLHTGLKVTAVTIDGRRARLNDAVQPGQRVVFEAGRKAEFHGRLGYVRTSLAKAVLKAANRGKRDIVQAMQSPEQLISAGKQHLARLQAELEELGNFAQTQTFLGCFTARRAQILYSLDRTISRKGFASIDEFCIVLALLDETDRTEMLDRLRTRILNNLVLINVRQNGDHATLELVVVDKPGTALSLFQQLKALGLIITQAVQQPVRSKPNCLSSNKLAVLKIDVNGWTEDTLVDLYSRLTRLYNDLPELPAPYGKKITVSCTIVDTRPDDLLSALEKRVVDIKAKATISQYRTRQQKDNSSFSSDTFLTVIAAIAGMGVSINEITFSANPKKGEPSNCCIKGSIPLLPQLKRFVPPAKRTSLREIPSVYGAILSNRLGEIEGTKGVSVFLG